MADQARHVVEEMKGIVHANTGVAREFLWHGTDTQHRTNCGTEVDQVDTYFSYQCATLPDCPTKVDTFAPKIVRALLRDLGYGIYRPGRNIFVTKANWHAIFGYHTTGIAKRTLLQSFRWRATVQPNLNPDDFDLSFLDLDYAPNSESPTLSRPPDFLTIRSRV